MHFIDDEDFEVSYERAKTLDVSVREYIGHVNERIEKIDEEVDWLRENPSSDFWQDLKNRVTKFTKEDLALSAEPYLNYIKMKKERENMLETETLSDDTAAAALQVSKDVFNELVNDEVTNAATELMNIKMATASILDNVIIGSVCQDGSFRIEKEDVTGKSNLFIGMMNDMRRDLYNISCDNSTGAPSYDMKRSQQIIDVVKKTATPCDDWRAIPQSVLRLMDALRDFTYDRAKLKPLVQAEKAHWKGTSFSKISTLVCPNIDFIVHLKIFPRKVLRASLIIGGSSSGRLAIWVAPWSMSEPYLAAVTPELPKRERGPVVDIKEGTLNNSQILYLLGNGHVRVWSLNEIPKPTTKKATHSSYMFPVDRGAYVPHSPASIFHMVPADMNMPVSKNASVVKAITNRGNAGEKKVESSDAALGVQTGLQPSSISFHPSLSLLGLNSAILVGSEGGDMIKFNIDTKNSAVDAPIVHLPPFIDREYTHPANARNDVVIARSLPNTKGNKVFRELFHFHKTKIVFIDIAMKTSDKIITVDQNGTLAVWKYAPQYFEQKFWFRPESSFALDFNRTEFQNASDMEPCAAPSELLEKKLLKVRLRDKDADNNLLEEYFPHKVKDKDEVYICQTDVKTEQKKWFCKSGISVLYFARFDDVRSSNDGTRIFFMVSYSTDIKFKSGKSFNSLVGFDTENLKFDPPFVKFQIDANDSICNYHIGPIISETLTRFAFIHTKTTLRVISLETAAEIVDETFPFKTKLLNFNPLMSALCPTQRLLAFGRVEDARIVIYNLSRQEDSSSNLLNQAVTEGLRSDPQYLQQLAISTNGRSALDFNRADKSLIDQFIRQIINECFDEALHISDADFSKKMKGDFLKGFYGEDSKLGVVLPVAWPSEICIANLLNDTTMEMYNKFLQEEKVT